MGTNWLYAGSTRFFYTRFFCAVVVLIFLAGCTPIRVPGPLEAPGLQESSSPGKSDVIQAESTGLESQCPLTEPLRVGPARDFALGGDWYRSEDGRLWLAKGGSWHEGGNKVPWIRPADTQLHVSGTRLDQTAPPLSAEIPDGYQDDFQVSGLTFPTGGCWQIEARAGDSSLVVVVEVKPWPAFANGNLPLIVTVGSGAHGQEMLRAGRIDPFYLSDLTQRPAIPLGHHYISALNSSGSMLAYIQWPNSSNNSKGTLHLVDLDRWETVDTGIRLDDDVPWLGFGTGGMGGSNTDQERETLYWLAPAELNALHGLGRGYRLYRFVWTDSAGDSEAVNAPAVIAELPYSFVPWEEHMLDQGKRLAIFGIPTSEQWLAEGAPRLFLVDLVTGEITGDTEFEHLTAGQLPPAEEDELYRHYGAGLAWDDERDRLYLVDPVSEQVTTVDLSSGQILDKAALHTPETLWARFVRWLMPVAQAKAGLEVALQAAVSPDGERLYLSGWQREMVRDEAGNWQPPQERSLGLRVIDLDTFTVGREIDLPVWQLHLSPTGEYLLLPRAGDIYVGDLQVGNLRPGEAQEGMTPLMGSGGLSIVDTASLEQVAYLNPGYPYMTVQGFSDDGRYAYVSYGVEIEKYEWETTLQLLDMKTFEIVAERPFPGGALDLIVSGPR